MGPPPCKMRLRRGLLARTLAAVLPCRLPASSADRKRPQSPAHPRERRHRRQVDRGATDSPLGAQTRGLFARSPGATIQVVVDELPRGTVTFLFTDIEGSTELVRRHQGRYVELLSATRSLLREAFAAHGGHEVDTQGDSFFVVFGRAQEAVLSAVAAQRALMAYAWPEEGRVRVRMGLHTAEPHAWAEGYVGVGVTRAARICAVGHGGQILLSRSTAGLIDDAELGSISLLDLGAHRFKGLQTAERIFQLVVEGLLNEFPPLETLEGAGVATETGTIVFADVEAFTALVRELPTDVFRALVAELHRIMRATLEEAGGHGVVVFGDSAMAVHRSARAALAGSLRLREAIACHAWPGGRPLTVNIVLHSGEVVATGYGYFGVAVNRAFAASESKSICGGQIVLSEATKHLLDDDNDLALRELVGAEAQAFPLFELISDRALDDALAMLAKDTH